MINMNTRVHSSHKHNKINKIRSEKREHNMREFERADVSYMDMFDGSQEITFTWEHA